jgi:hypothetical protein
MLPVSVGLLVFICANLCISLRSRNDPHVKIDCTRRVGGDKMVRFSGNYTSLRQDFILRVPRGCE